MPSTIRVFEDARAGIGDIGPALDLLDKADKQQGRVREGAISVIHGMCDALQGGADIVAHELSATIMEFNDLSRRRLEEREPPEILDAQLRGFLERTAARFTNPALRQKLHEGHVCGALHALGDRLGTGLGSTATSPFWDNLRAFVTRSTPMSIAIGNLISGEQAYLHQFVWFLDDVRNKAEAAVGTWGEDAWREAAALVQLMRDKRADLSNQAATVRNEAYEVIRKLH